MAFRVSLSDSIGWLGIISAIVLLVLDKAGKLRGGWLYGLLVLAGGMTLFIALGNDWVMDAPARWKLWRGLFMFVFVALTYSGLAILISGGPEHDGQEVDENTLLAKGTETLPSFLFIFGAPLGENDSPVWVMLHKHYGPSTAYNCDIVFIDNDRKNIEHQWLVEHPNSSFLPPEGVAGKSQLHFHFPEAGPEGSIGNFQWTPIDPNNQHYTVSSICRDGAFIENWEVTRIDGVLRTKITIEHGPQWVERNPTLSPIVFTCTEPGFISSPLASVLPTKKPQPVNPGWRPNHRFEFPVAILDPNGNVQALSGVKLPDGSRRTDFGCWNLITKHFGDAP